MIPRLHPKGHSFKGAAAYLLHDKKADTTERVAWAETRNLATDKPEVAWRLMAATALSQDELKAEAGIKNTGRKSSAHVLHFSLSWTADEATGLTREEMLRAAHGALRALSASDRQAIIVSHNDEPHPHVHILLNRVSPEDGRMLSSSKEKLVLSQWAESYERERGEILCEERVINNAARNRKQYTRSADKQRVTYEQEKASANDNTSRRPKAAQIASQRRQLAARHIAAWKALETANRTRKATISDWAKQETFVRERAIRDRYRTEWTTLFHEQQADRREYEKREQHLLGRADNALRVIDFGAILRSGDRRAAITKAFRVFSSSGARLEELKRTHAVQARALAARQQREERAAKAEIAAERAIRLEGNRTQLFAERSALAFTQTGERAALKSAWRSLPRAPRAAAITPRLTDGALSDLQAAFQKAAAPPPETRVVGGEDDRARSLAAMNRRILDQRRQPRSERDRDDRER